LSDNIWLDWWHTSDWVVQAVLVLLLGLSVLSWTVILAKAGRFLSVLRGEARAAAAFEAGGAEAELPPSLPTAQMQQRARALLASRPRLAADRERLTDHFERWLGEQRLILGGNLTLLATIGNAAPFIGLFGTVWGIMHAFFALAGVQQATIAMVAPGIAEALIATAMGLVAAIPAVIAYNRYSNQVYRLEVRMDNFKEEFAGILFRQARKLQDS